MFVIAYFKFSSHGKQSIPSSRPLSCRQDSSWAARCWLKAWRTNFFFVVLRLGNTRALVLIHTIYPYCVRSRAKNLCNLSFELWKEVTNLAYALGRCIRSRLYKGKTNSRQRQQCRERAMDDCRQSWLCVCVVLMFPFPCPLALTLTLTPARSITQIALSCCFHVQF